MPVPHRSVCFLGNDAVDERTVQVMCQEQEARQKTALARMQRARKTDDWADTSPALLPMAVNLPVSRVGMAADIYVSVVCVYVCMGVSTLVEAFL